MEEQLREYINSALGELGLSNVSFVVERPADMSHGDWATNVAMAGGKLAGKNPRQLAEELIAIMSRLSLDMRFEIAGQGFINIKLSKEYYVKELELALATENYGNNEMLKGKKVIVEYTDPNPFKEFHIGHLMSNTIGESISRLVEASGAETKRACYQGDVGLHVAKAIWGIIHTAKAEGSLGSLETPEAWDKYRGGAYALGAKRYEDDPAIKEEIEDINRKLYAKHEDVFQVYEFGKGCELNNFETIYKRLGTHHGGGWAFNYYFFESATGTYGKELVEEHPEIFEKSDGAIVYKGDETKGLHTRVFINKDGLPTYEAKELGLAKIKYNAFPYDTSIVITGNEVNDYFRVLLDAMSKVFPDLAQKTEHYSHGMLRLPSGKMSSRTGDVITAESLIEETKVKALAKNTDEKFTDAEKDEIAEKVAIGAIKYSILRQAAGKDIVFDFEQSLSFEGDSGPYLQYAHARTRSLLEKAGEKNHNAQSMESEEVGILHKHLLRFPEVVARAAQGRASHLIATYLIELAREFNSFYANTIVLDGSSDESYKLALVEMTSRILRRGLWVLGISAPEKM